MRQTTNLGGAGSSPAVTARKERLAADKAQAREIAKVRSGERSQAGVGSAWLTKDVPTFNWV